ncbi:MAG: hypothetical protein LBD46_08870 [Endomicrobium sp.]|nr:hypothetical protein [Endomicrobium sp.]
MKFLKLFFAMAIVCCISILSFAKDSSDKYLLNSLKAAEKYNKKMKYKHPKLFKIYDSGTEEWIDYEKYGEFKNLGTDKYKYVPNNFDGLRAASGEGIYPNTQSVYNSPEYKKFSYQNKLEGNKWNFVNTDDYQANFYKWAIEREEPGVKLYFTAAALDRAGHYKHAVKAYYACLVFFPKSIGYTEYGTPWYIATVCIDRINYLTKKYPEIGVKLIGADITIDNTFDNDVKNDIFYINPGKLEPAHAKDFERKFGYPEKTGIKKIVGSGRVKLIQYNNDNFRLMVDDKPYVVKAISYAPNKIGLYPGVAGFNNNKDWSYDDYDKNGKIDGPYDAWVDANRNEKRDKNEKSVGDFALMKEMGVNSLRIYHHRDINKQLLKEGYEKYGFMYLMGDFVGMYAVDSGASWKEGTNYADPKQRKNMLNNIKKMVEQYKDEPYILMWVLGNENNYSDIGDITTSSKVQYQPDTYYKFVNECAKLIKSLDPHQRPVAICNGDLYLLNYCVENVPDADIYGTNSYRGEQGFGSIWKDVKRFYNKAVLITEYGCPAYASGWSTGRIEAGQSSYHKGCWENIEDNMAGVEGGSGNSLGGVIFEWCDEWWKAQNLDPNVHDTTKQYGGGFLDGGGYEEWFGIVGIGENGEDSTFKRQLRETYFMYRQLWNAKINDNNR